MKARSYSYAQSGGAALDLGLRRYMLGVFNYMGSGLVLSGVLALFTFSNQWALQLAFETPLRYVVQFGPLVMILGLMFGGVQRLSVSATQVFYWVFVSLMGISLSYWGLVYSGQSIARAFFIAAAAFGAMSLYGYTTKRDLTKMNSFLFMGMIGLLLAIVVNVFLASNLLQFVISAAGVLIFTVLTAFQVQSQKSVYYGMAGNEAGLHKQAVFGALDLYLSFINMFQFLLYLIGERE